MSILLDGLNGITTPAETVQGALTTTGNTILGDAATDTLNVGAGGLVKDASGNVGIGTASPTSRLQVGDATVNTSNAIILGKYNAASEANLPAIRQISAGTGNDLAIAATSGSGAIRFYTGGADSSLALGTANNAERMRIDSSGNAMVGITSINAGTGFTGQSNRLVAGNIIGTSGGFGAGGFAAASTTASFVVGNNGALRVTIYSTNSSATARIGQYIFVGLDRSGGYNPTVLTLGTTGTPQWTFSYALSGSYNTTVTVTAGADNQGTRIFIEPLG
jgi:hypothetical protein